MLVTESCGASWAVHVAAGHPDRVLGLMAIAPSCGLDVATPGRDHVPWDEPLDTPHGWAKYNKHYWLGGGYDDFTEFFFRQDVLRAALDQADRGLHRLGARDLAARPSRTPPRAGSGARARCASRSRRWPAR